MTFSFKMEETKLESEISLLTEKLDHLNSGLSLGASGRLEPQFNI